MLRTAIIGITGYGREHLRILLHGHKRGLLQPFAAVVINPDEAIESVNHLSSLGCRIYASVEKMWEQENGSIDLCMIPTSIATHHPFARMALEHGSHVFAEKPICGTVQEVNDLVDLAAARKRALCVGFQDMYSEQVRSLKQRILSGEFGKVHHLKGWGSWPRGMSYYERNDWAGSLKSGASWVLDSPVNNAMAHFLTMLLYWGGDTVDGFVTPRQLEGELYRAQAISSFDTATFRIQTEEGPEIFYAVTHSGERAVQPFLRIECEKAVIEWTHCGAFEIKTENGTTTEPYGEMDRLRERMIEQICAHVNGQEAQVCQARNAVVHTRVVNALHESTSIREFPKSAIQFRQAKGNTFTFIPGLVEDLESAFRDGKLLSEVRPSFRNTQPPFPMENYREFTGVAPGSAAAIP